MSGVAGEALPRAGEGEVAEIIALGARHGLELRPESVRFEEAGLDFRVAFALSRDETPWVLRLPRRPDVAERLDGERRVLEFVAPRLPVPVPRWEVCAPELVAYRRLPGAPGLTLSAAGEPVWAIDPLAPDFAASLGRLIASLHGIDVTQAAAAGVPVLTLEALRARWAADLERVRGEFPIAAARLGAWEAWLADDGLWQGEPVMTHGELYAAHVLVDLPAEPGRITGVLDWTTARVADPAVDFAFQHMMGPAALAATEAAYRAAGGSAHPRLAERCAAIVAASPLAYAVFALASGAPEHRAQAAAGLREAVG